jgi:hypothetical protein
VRKYRGWSSAASRNVRSAGRQVLASLDRNDTLELLQEGLHNLQSRSVDWLRSVYWRLRWTSSAASVMNTLPESGR